MRINKYIAASTELSRRAADQAIAEGRVLVNSAAPLPGASIKPTDNVTLDGKTVTPKADLITIMINKPTGFVCSRNGQGSETIYELLPPELQHLQPVGRLDKDSSGLLLMTNDGQLANQLTHPSYEKQKVYEISLNTSLASQHVRTISGSGVKLEDGPSILGLKPLDTSGKQWRVTMHEGRNRQIRRTFAELGYTVTTLKRVSFGDYRLSQLAPTQRYLVIS